MIFTLHFKNLDSHSHFLVHPLLSDDPQTVIMMAKLIDDIIFIGKVHNLGMDIRMKTMQTTTMNLGQPALKEEFRESFKAMVPQEKSSHLEKVDVAEWTIINNLLAKNLKESFCSGGICDRLTCLMEQSSLMCLIPCVMISLDQLAGLPHKTCLS